MTTLILIAALGLAAVYGLCLMNRLDSFLSGPRRRRGPRPKRMGAPLGKLAGVMLHGLLNHLYGLS